LTTKRKLLIDAAIIILAIAAWFAGLFAFVNDINAMSTPQPSQKLDAIVVLTGGSNRIDAGFNLLEQQLGQKLFISGVGHGLDVKQLLTRWKAEPQSNLDCCVEVGSAALDTSGNAVETAEWLHKENLHTIYLVTANYHMRRAMLEFRRLAPDVTVTPYPVTPDKFNLILVTREYTKFLLAYIRSLL
jgi:uncharacterized SAM-binding protein YcdF (DUF218 family)